MNELAAITRAVLLVGLLIAAPIFTLSGRGDTGRRKADWFAIQAAMTKPSSPVVPIAEYRARRGTSSR